MENPAREESCEGEGQRYRLMEIPSTGFESHGKGHPRRRRGHALEHPLEGRLVMVFEIHHGESEGDQNRDATQPEHRDKRPPGTTELGTDIDRKIDLIRPGHHAADGQGT